MKRILILGIVLAVVPAMNALAARCVAPKDTMDVVTGTGTGQYNIPMFAESDIVFCDDFDTYCSDNYTNTIYWPGYPPSPDTTLCTTETPGTYGEWWMKSANTIDHHNWDKDWGGPNFGVTSAAYDDSTHTGLCLEGWDITCNWKTMPYVAFQAGNQGGGAGRASYDFDMTQGIAHKFSGFSAVNGTNNNPLILRYWLNDNASLTSTGQPGWGKPPAFQFFVDLNLSNDRAPVDYVMSADTIPLCGTEQVNWPIICQQNPSGQGSLPTNCPDIGVNPRPIHHSLAFGWVAALDLNPCDVDTGRNPTMYHAATFDGQQWFRLISGQHTGSGDFNWDMQQAFFEMTIRAADYDVRLIAPHGSGSTYAITTNTATGLTRNYTGPFDRISMGAGLGCELDPANAWQCKSGSTRNVAAWNWVRADNVYVDRVVLLYGEGIPVEGACCVQTGEFAGTCTDNVAETACTGVWHGSGSTCATSEACCPMPFADADHDGDVDQDDFGTFQACYTGATSGVAANCACYDRDTSSAIDNTDLLSFINCWTGPNVPWAANLTPNCVN